MTRLLLAYSPLLLWAAGVLVIGALDPGAASLPSGADKAAHFVMYGVGGALAALGRRWSRRGGAAVSVAALGLIVMVAAADELRQSRLPYRTGDPLDFVADVAGALVFYLLVSRLFGNEGSE